MMNIVAQDLTTVVCNYDLIKVVKESDSKYRIYATKLTTSSAIEPSHITTLGVYKTASNAFTIMEQIQDDIEAGKQLFRMPTDAEA